jgi:hypothetical protein
MKDNTPKYANPPNASKPQISISAADDQREANSAGDEREGHVNSSCDQPAISQQDRPQSSDIARDRSEGEYQKESILYHDKGAATKGILKRNAGR